MSLAAGTKLGPYEILAPIGAGGMGEVYKARDARLERTVAVKVLPPHLSSNPELRQRFEREARTISQISHPHICALYDVNREGETEYLVMEYLEGETLADRLGRGPLPGEQLLRYAIEIADALDKAHRQGIVHRDLKPGNVMLTKSGVKLLDFGLAKFQAAAVKTTSDSRLVTEMQASRPLTERGTVLGTFQYMAPEQLEGKDADARSDLFAFGAMLYEMATGRKAFTGSSQASLIGAILRDDPPAISEISPMTPPALNRVVKTCLAKDPEDRFQTAHDVKLQLQWIAEGGSQAGLPVTVAGRRKSRERLAWIIAAAALVAAAVAGYGFVRRTPAPPLRLRAYLLAPEKTEFEIGAEASGDLSLSPDGHWATFATKGIPGRPTLWIQALGETSPRRVAEGATFPFWSPDSRFLAYFADGKLQKIDAAGGPAFVICEAPNGRSGGWNRDGVIIFSADPSSGIVRVPASGGRPAPVTALDASHGETTHRWATFLPDGLHFLYMAASHGAGAKSETNAVYVGRLDAKERELLLHVRSNVAYASGRLLYMRDDLLVAQRLDPGTLRLSGDPVPIAQGVAYDPGFFRANFGVSENGLLLFGAGVGGARTQLRWFDRTGKPVGEPLGEPAEFTTLGISFDGKRIVAAIADPGTGLPSLWLVDGRGARVRFTTGAGVDSPVWSPDGEWIAYGRMKGTGSEIVAKRVVGGEERVLATFPDRLASPTDWSPDGRVLAVQVSGANKRGFDIWIVSASGNDQPYAFVKSEGDDFGAAFSPDGHWLSYVSSESGQPDLYVVPFPGPGGKWQVSTEGTGGGGFSGKGLEILYGNLKTGQAMSVELKATGSGLEIGEAKALFPMVTFAAIAVSRQGDGQFLLAVPPGGAAEPRVGLITDWTAGLDKK